ncbi:MAG TPA: amidohydrolase family protein [Spirochaetota bacterium]|nr:amidohydrolase family protein [Spirochaetota bacterium]
MKDLSRKEFLRMSARTTASALAATTVGPYIVSGLTGCTSTSLVKDMPKVDYRKEIRLVNCRIIDVNAGRIINNGTIRINNGRITAVSDRALPENRDAEIFNIKNQYVMPGLINGHCHLTIPAGSYLVSMAKALDLLTQMKRNFSLNIEHGITTVRDMGGYPGLIRDYIAQSERGNFPGPRVMHSNAFLSVKGGYIEIDEKDLHPLGSLFVSLMGAGSISTKVTGMKDLQEKIRENIRNAGLIKVSSMDTKPLVAGKKSVLPVFTDEELAYIFDYAQKNNLPCALHNMTMQAFRRAIQYPFHSLEHVVVDGYISDADIATMRKRNISIVPTVILGNLYACTSSFGEFPKEFRTDFIMNEIKIRESYWNSVTSGDVVPSIHESNVRAMGWFRQYNYDYEKMFHDNKLAVDPFPFFNYMIYGVKNVQKMRHAGVLIGCGTDSGVPWNYHGTLWREMEMYSRIGFTNAEIVRCATMNNAKIMGMDKEIGSIEQGKLADIIVMKDNPLADIRAVRDIRLVFLGGKVAAQKCGLVRGDAGIAVG